MGPGEYNWKHIHFAIFLAQMLYKNVYCPYRERSPVLRHHMIYCSLNTCFILLKTWFHGSIFFVMGVPFRRKGAVRCRYNAVDFLQNHYGDIIMDAIASQITSLTIVYSIVYSDADQRKHQSSASLAFVRGIHRGPVNSPHKWPVTRKMFPFDDVIMYSQKTPHSSPVRSRFGVSFVSSKSDLWSGVVIAVLYVISWYIVPRYSGTELYWYWNKPKVSAIWTINFPW